MILSFYLAIQSKAWMMDNKNDSVPENMTQSESFSVHEHTHTSRTHPHKRQSKGAPVGHSSSSETQYHESNRVTTGQALMKHSFKQTVALNLEEHNSCECVWVRPVVLCFEPGQARPVCGSHSRWQHAERGYLCQGRSKTDHWSFSHIRHSLPALVKACESSSPFSKDTHVEPRVKSDKQRQHQKCAWLSE